MSPRNNLSPFQPLKRFISLDHQCDQLDGPDGPNFEVLERRQLLTSYVVDTVLDQNDGMDVNGTSLREAIHAANLNGGADTIAFDADVFHADGTISLSLGELEITDDVVIAGATDQVVTVDAMGMNQAFDIQSGVTASMSDITVTGIAGTNDQNAHEAHETDGAEEADDDATYIDWQGQQIKVVENSWIISAEEGSYTARWLERLTDTYEDKKIWGTGSGYISVSHAFGGTYEVVTEKSLTAKQIKRFFGSFTGFNLYEPNAIIQTTFTPNDTNYGLQWGHTKIDAPDAWDIHQGDDEVIVAVIDTGINYDHNDLTNNMWVNTLELGGTDGVDDDGNGFVDDIYGYDFAGTDRTDSDNNEDSDPMDVGSHGTHVAGIIGAEGNNSLGISGVNPNVKLMAIKVFDNSGSGTTIEIAQGLNYMNDMAADGHNIRVANMSIGYSSSILSSIISISEGHDILIVASAGNGGADNIGDDNDTTPQYPASYPNDNVISVASTNSSDTLATSSNYGATSVDLSAPGVSIYSTVLGNSYGYKSGTSMAAPQVAGALSLLLSYNPSLTAAEAKAHLLASVDAVASLDGKVVSGGRLNLHQLMLLGKAAPDDLTLDNATVDENSTVGLTVGTITVSDDNPSDTHTLTLLDDAGGLFDMDASGVVTVDSASLDHEDEDTHEIVVQATDNDSQSYTETLTITVSDVNESPYNLILGNASIDEDASDPVVGTVTVSDDDATETISFSVTDDAGDLYDIDANGVLSVNDLSALDADTDDEHVVVITATDSGLLSVTETVTITIGAVNEAPVISGFSTSAVDENTSDTTIGSVSFSDPENDTVTLSISDDAGGIFQINSGGTVTITDLSALDHELDDGQHELEVVASDGLLSTTETFTLTINDVNESPYDLSLDNASIDENTSDSVVGTVTVSDDDDSDTIGFSVSDDAGGIFSIDSNGVLTVNDLSALDHEDDDAHVVVVTATDSGLLSTSSTLTITVSDVNESPYDLSLDNASIDENTSDPVVGTVTVSDDDDGDTIGFSVSDDAGGIFSIDSNGVLTVSDLSALDHEDDDEHVVVVTATDSGLLSTSSTLTITVSDVNESPYDLSLDNASIDENTSDPVVGTVTVSDDDDGDTIGFSVSDDAGGIFSIDSNGVLTVNDLSALDHEDDDAHVVVVTATDSGLLSTSETLTITVTDVNESPYDLSLDNESIDENTSDPVVGTVTVSDDDDGDTIGFSISDDAGGIFSIDSNGVLTVNDLSALDHEDDDEHVVVVTATDSGLLSTSETLTISVSDVNESPVISGFSTSAVDENTSDTTIGSVSFSDPENDTVTLSISDDAGGIFQINSGGTVTVTDLSALDHELNDGQHELEVVASDGLLSTTETFTLTINDVNESPYDLSLDNASIAENTSDPVVGTVTVSDDDDGDTIGFSMSDDAGGIFSIDSSGVLTVNDLSALDHEDDDEHVVVVTATDSGLLSTSETLTISVGDVNEAPVISGFSTSAVDENISDTTIGSVSFSDPENDTVTLIISDDAGGIFQINSGGTVTITDLSALDHELNDGQHELEVVASDGLLSTTETFTLTINDVNESPYDLSLDNTSIDENTSASVVGTVTVSDDDDGDTIGYSVTDDAGGIFSIDSSGVLTVNDLSALDHEDDDEHVVVVTATDSGLLSTSSTLTITVTDVNESPYDLSLDNATIVENTSDPVVGTVTVSDDDDSDTIGFSVSDDAGGIFSIDSNGVLTVNDLSALDHEDDDEHVVVITATDSGSLSTRSTLTITVSDVNESPYGLSLDNASIEENTSDPVVGTVTVSDDDNGDTIGFSVSDDAGGIFSIDSSGVLTVNDLSALDHEDDDEHVVVVTATDSGLLSTNATLTISVSDVNESPYDLSLDNATIAENASDPVVGTVTVSDDDDGDTVGYSVTDDAGGIFSIDSNGVLTVNDLSALDHEDDDEHVVVVTATDSGLLSTSETLTITVSDVNEVPTDMGITNSEIPEDISDGGTVGTVSTTDVDGGDSHTYVLTDDAGGRFAINATSGVVTVVDGDMIDYDANNSHQITVEVTDSGSLTFEKIFTVSVTKVFFAPTDITIDEDTVDEGTASGSLVATVSAVDQAGDTHTYVLVDDAEGRFAIDSATGEITLVDTSLIDPEVNGSHDIIVRATDQTSESLDKTITLQVAKASGSLTPQKLPHAVVTGSTLSGKMRASITNDSGEDFGTDGTTEAKLIARSLDGSTEVVIAERTIGGKWQQGKAKNISFSVSHDGLPAGEYQLVAIVTHMVTDQTLTLFASQDDGNPFILNVSSAAYVDLVATIALAKNAATNIQAGADKTKVEIEIENHGTTLIENKLIDINIYAEDTLGNRISSPVATIAGMKLNKLDPTGVKRVKATIVMPAGMTPDTYHLVAEIDAGDAIAESNTHGTGESNNETITSETVNVTSGIIDLSGAVSDKVGTPTYNANDPIEARRRFTITNSGTVSAPKGAAIDLVMNVYDSSDVLVATQTIEGQSISNLKSGKGKKVTVNHAFGLLSPGSYRVEVAIQPENFTDSVLTNNTFEFLFDVV